MLRLSYNDGEAYEAGAYRASRRPQAINENKSDGAGSLQGIVSAWRYFESCCGEVTADTLDHLPPRLAQRDVTEFFIVISLSSIKARASTW